MSIQEFIYSTLNGSWFFYSEYSPILFAPLAFSEKIAHALFGALRFLKGQVYHEGEWFDRTSSTDKR